MKANIYQILGITEKVSAGAVKKAYREFVKKNHPDIYPGDKAKEDNLKQATFAYHTWLLMGHNMSEVKRIMAHSEEFRPASGIGQYIKKYEKVRKMVYGQRIGNRNSIYGNVGLLRKIELYA